MTAPTALATGTVTWTVTGITGANPAEAAVTFVAAPTLLLASDPEPVTVLPEPVGPIPLEVDGSLEPVELLATDAAGVTPTGWTWTAYLRVRGVARAAVTFTLDTGAEVDLTRVATVVMDRGAPVIRGPQGETGPAGPQGPPGADGADGQDGADAVIPERLSQASLDAAYPSRAEVPRLPGLLGGWKAKVATQPGNAKVVLVGDSTADPALNAAHIYRRLLSLHTQQGEALYGVGSSDYFTDGVGNGTTTFTSASAAFTAGDVGRLMHGKGFPIGVKITARNSATSVTLSVAVPAGTSLPFWVGRHVIGGGNNGKPLLDWMNSPSDVSSPYNRDKLVADAPDLTVASWLINDVRQGALGLTVDAIVAAGTARLQAFVDWHRATLPNTDLLLRMPNPFLTANVSSQNYVTDGTTTNPAGLAQIYSTALRRIYLGFVGRYPNVDVLDVQAEVFGTRSVTSHALMADQIHPSGNVSGDVNLLTSVGGGYVAIADALARRIGFARNAFPPDAVTRARHEFIVYDAPAAGSVRLISRDYNVPAPQAPVFRTDSLYVNGLDSPIALTSATIDRNFGVNILTITGLGSTSFAPHVGQTALVTGDHPNAATGDRRTVNIDLPSIAAGATITHSVTLSGIAAGNQGHAMAVIPSPAGGFSSSGLLLLGCYPSGTDTLRLVVNNPTAGAVDQVAENWTFWVVR